LEEPFCSTNCPNCGKKALLTHSEQEIPHFGKILISTLYCRSCSFKWNDIIALDSKEPNEFRCKVSSENDLKIKIVKSSSATIIIPELGVEIEPGIASDGYISNIEGLLVRIEEATGIIFRSSSGQQKKAAEKLLKKIFNAKNGKLAFEVIVLDPLGNSGLIGNGVKKRKLSEKEASSLKKGINIIELNH
jgi:zinc finger protein